MSVNSSYFDDISPPAELTASNSSIHAARDRCFRSEVSLCLFTACCVTTLLLFPLFTFVLYLGYQQWRQRRSSCRAAMSHTDVFTYHSIAMQLYSVVGFSLYFWGGYMNVRVLEFAGVCIMFITVAGQSLFHILTCVERYLAVVKPITYQGLKQAGGVRIRNISIGCVWFVIFVVLTVNLFCHTELETIIFFFFVGLCLIIISYCSISVLRALRRPGPGEVGGNRDRVDQSKQRAFYTIVAILGTLLFRFGGNLLSNIITTAEGQNNSQVCVLLVSFWLDLPSSLVLPLLLLQRAGKLGCCKQTPESG